MTSAEIPIEKKNEISHRGKALEAMKMCIRDRSQTAQEICKLLDKSWKSFYRLKESGGIENPGTPRYKKDKMPITYMQNGIQHENGSYNVRLSLPKKLKEYMAHTYDIRAAYLYLKNPVFSNMDIIKQIKIYPPADDGTSRILVIHEVEDVLPEEYNVHRCV